MLVLTEHFIKNLAAAAQVESFHNHMLNVIARRSVLQKCSFHYTLHITVTCVSASIIVRVLQINSFFFFFLL